MTQAWDRLYTPHRMSYLKGEGKPAHSDSGDECPFCRAPGASAEEGLVFARGEHVFALLNLYPYNSGHVMVCPYRHVADYTELTHDEVVELAAFTQKSMKVLRSLSGAHGFNIGMNQGASSGAGIAAHLHQHVVPRWGGDTNFMPIIGGTKVIPQLLEDTRELLEVEWAKA
jgi:ATP adenylyltransferase